MHKGVTRGHRAGCEFVGTAILLVAVVGSGIMAERLSSGNAAIALLANTLATGGTLFAIIATFGPYSDTLQPDQVRIREAAKVLAMKV